MGPVRGSWASARERGPGVLEGPPTVAGRGGHDIGAEVGERRKGMWGLRSWERPGTSPWTPWGRPWDQISPRDPDHRAERE